MTRFQKVLRFQIFRFNPRGVKKDVDCVCVSGERKNKKKHRKKENDRMLLYPIVRHCFLNSSFI